MMFNAVFTIFLRMGIINKIRILEKEDSLRRLKDQRDHWKYNNTHIEDNEKIVKTYDSEIRIKQRELEKLKQ